jgi:signal peptidase I
MMLRPDGPRLPIPPPERALPAGGRVSPAAEKKPRHPWRENVEAMTVAIVMAVMLKYFAIEAYQIPTGSMQPTLMGQEFRQGTTSHGDIKDRILVDKFSFHWRDPERFEVVIFKYPLNRAQNFVKRLVGMPGEQIRIEYGDVWRRGDESQEWKVLRRPSKVQADQWKAIDVGEPTNGIHWRAEDAKARVQLSGRDISAEGAVRLAFAAHGKSSITDFYTHGYPLGMQQALRLYGNTQPDNHDVGDLRVTGTIEPRADLATFVVELAEGDWRYRFELPGPAAPAEAKGRIHVDWGARTAFEPIDVAVPGARLDGTEQEFAVENLDDQLALELDGERIASVPIQPAANQRSGVVLALEGGGADLTDLQVWRDIYYFVDLGVGGPKQWTIPEGHYFMLGDNTQDSSDGRYWKTVQLSWNEPPSQGQPFFGNQRGGGGGYNPDANPNWSTTKEGVRMTYFRDIYGELHVFPSTSELSGPHPLEGFEHFVPRHLITGRALAVFWPFSFKYSTYRLKWVH